MAGVTDKNALKAGGFILGALVLAGLIVYFVAGGSLFGGGQRRTVAFPLDADIAGLAEGSEVRVGGKTVGEVTGIGFGGDYKEVLVGVSLPGDLVVRQGATVRVQSSLTGIVNLNFTDLGDGQPLAEDKAVPGQANTLNDLILAAAQVAPEAKRAIRTLTDSTLPRADAALVSIEDAATRTASAAGNFDAVLNDSELRVTLDNLRQASDRLPKLAQDAKSFAAEASSAIQDVRSTVTDAGQRLNNVLDQADGATGDLAAAAADARETFASARGVVAGNRGKIDQITSRLVDTARTLDLASSEIRRSPWRLLYKPSGEQRANLNLYDAARQFAEGANALQDAAVALEGAAADPSTDPQRVRELLTEVRERFERFDEVERALYQRIRD